MINIISNYNKIDIAKWSTFVYEHPYGNIFQTPEMFKVYQKTKNYEPVLVVATDDNGGIAGVLLSVVQKEYSGIAGTFTARAIIFGGPLIKDNNPQILDLILKTYDKVVKRKAIYSQFRNMLDWGELKEVFIKNNIEYLEHYNVIVDLQNKLETLYSNLHNSKRRQIKKAFKLGVNISEAQEEKDIEALYRILFKLYTEKVKKPLPSLEFFLNLFNNLKSKDLIKIFVIKYDGKIIGGIICPISKNKFNKVIYEFYICSDDRYKKFYPGILATWAPIKWGNENGLNAFDFMGAGNPKRDYGVRDFKLQFGGQLVNYGRFEKIHKPILMGIGKIGFKIWQKIK